MSKKKLTISRWQSLRCSLSSFVFPVPGPVIELWDIVTYLAQAIDKSSKTCFRRVSVSGWSDSIDVVTSERPSS